MWATARRSPALSGHARLGVAYRVITVQRAVGPATMMAFEEEHGHRPLPALFTI
jgi:hypothetical protein